MRTDPDPDREEGDAVQDAVDATVGAAGETKEVADVDGMLEHQEMEDSPRARTNRYTPKPTEAVTMKTMRCS